MIQAVVSAGSRPVFSGALARGSLGDGTINHIEALWQCDVKR
jgi:hypothetical protein